MPKVNRVEPCIFCGSLPCTCDGPKVKAKPAKQKRKVENTKPIDDISFEMPETKPKFTAPTKKKERDLDMEYALRAVYPILAPKEKAKVRALLEPPLPADLDKQVASWKDRNGF